MRQCAPTGVPVNVFRRRTGAAMEAVEHIRMTVPATALHHHHHHHYLCNHNRSKTKTDEQEDIIQSGVGGGRTR